MPDTVLEAGNIVFVILYYIRKMTKNMFRILVMLSEADKHRVGL